MSMDEGLVGYVPYLRRFARALTGTQQLGDACVVAAIERILDNPPNQSARITLYRNVLAEVDRLEARGIWRLCSAARSDAQLNDLVPCGPPADRAPLLFSVHAMLVSVMLWIGGALVSLSHQYENCL